MHRDANTRFEYTDFPGVLRTTWDELVDRWYVERHSWMGKNVKFPNDIMDLEWTDRLLNMRVPSRFGLRKL